MVIEFEASANSDDSRIHVVVSIVMNPATGWKWARSMSCSEFMAHFVIAEGFLEKFEGEQGRVAIEPLKCRLNLTGDQSQ